MESPATPSLAAPAPAVPDNGVDAIRAPLLTRAGMSAARRLRLIFYRLRHPRVRFGHGCDVRRGLWILALPGSRLTVGHHCVLDRDMTIECHGALTIGDRTIFGHHCTIGVRQSVEIGPDCLIADMVAIRDHDHRFDRLDVPVREQGVVAAPIKIGRNVWIGGKVTIVKGVTIGDNAVIGANAVVTRDIPANAVAVGLPARVIRMRTAAT